MESGVRSQEHTKICHMTWKVSKPIIYSFLRTKISEDRNMHVQINLNENLIKYKRNKEYLFLKVGTQKPTFTVSKNFSTNKCTNYKGKTK